MTAIRKSYVSFFHDRFLPGALAVSLLAACGGEKATGEISITNAEIAPVSVERTIQPGLLDNASEFDSEFFRKFELKHAQEPLRLSATVSKNYLFPTFYDDVTVAAAMFFCSYAKASAVLPHPSMKPISMGRDRALIIFSSYQYNRVLGIAPYREIAVSIPVLVDTDSILPLYPLLAEDYAGAGIYVLSMPVTTLENKIRGRRIWGLAKEVERIDFSADEAGYRTAATGDGQSAPYLSFFVPFAGDKTHIERSYTLYTLLDGKLLSAPTRSAGTYLVRRDTGRLLGAKDAEPDREYLRLGSGPMADRLRGLEIEPAPFQTQFGRHVASLFELPSPENN